MEGGGGEAGWAWRAPGVQAWARAGSEAAGALAAVAAVARSPALGYSARAHRAPSPFGARRRARSSGRGCVCWYWDLGAQNCSEPVRANNSPSRWQNLRESWYWESHCLGGRHSAVID